MILYLLCLALFCIGLYGVLRKRNLVKIIIGLGIIEYSMNLFFVLLGYRFHGRAPIDAQDQNILNMVDPLPQAMAITVMLTGLATTVLMVAIAIRLYDRFGTFDITKIRKLKG